MYRWSKAEEIQSVVLTFAANTNTLDSFTSPFSFVITLHWSLEGLADTANIHHVHLPRESNQTKKKKKNYL